jgi:LCP family protein required for cell wall assembly
MGGRLAHRCVKTATARWGLALPLDAATDASPIVTMLVGSDGRGSLPLLLRRIDDVDVADRRADAIGILVTSCDGGDSILFRVPRDVLVQVPGVGEQRLGWALSYGGPARLIETVRNEFAIPVHHYFEIGFAAFSRIVTAHGGLPRAVAGQRSDARTGLKRSRALRVSGRRALALARSRTPVGGPAMTDVERIAVQDDIVRALVRGRSRARLVFSACALVPRVRRDVVFDESWTAADAATVLRSVHGANFAVHHVKASGPPAREDLVCPFAPTLSSTGETLRMTDFGRLELAAACLGSAGGC